MPPYNKGNVIRGGCRLKPPQRTTLPPGPLVKQGQASGPAWLGGVYDARVEVGPGRNRFFQFKPLRVPGYQVLP